jgi:hypothetical protein
MGRGGHRMGSGRKSGWRHPETQTIRVPKIFAAQILEYARLLDYGSVLPLTEPSLKNMDILDSETNSNHEDVVPGQLKIFGVIDSVSESKKPPKKPDGLRWLSSKGAWEIAQKRGCARNLEGFRKWSARHPEECLVQYGLSRLPTMPGNSTIPAYEDTWHEKSDCPDF